LSAPALVTTPAYQDDPDPQNALPTLGFVERLRQVPGVAEAAPRLEFFALLRSPYTSESAQVRGVNPALEPAVSDVPSSITEGRMLSGRGEVVLGKDLAERLDVRLGERLAVDVSSRAGPQAAGLVAVGFVNTGIAALDVSLVLVHLEDSRVLTGVGTATGIALDVPRGQEEAVAARVQEVLPDGTRAYGLRELLGTLSDELDNNAVQMIPIGLLFALFAALAVTSTVLVSVLERRREFGMMAAIGLAPSKLARMVVIEAVAATVLGWLVGLAIGYALTWLFGTYNILGTVMAGVNEAFASFGLGDELYTVSSPRYALYAGATVAFAAIFALLIPARQVARLEPVTAMRAE
jgi:lipoprotein-releasing system permease protein